MIGLKICDWLEEQSYWEQCIGDAILKGKSLSSEELDEIYQLLKKEFNLTDQNLHKSAFSFLGFTNHVEDKNQAKLKKVSSVRGVNALSSNETLEIGNQLTLIYGENGSGKSGYTRLFNNAFISRGDKNILPNIFVPNNSEVGATFSFENEEGLVTDFFYPIDSSHNHFKKVSVFDTVSAMTDLTNETELSFAPIEFNFFDKYVNYFSEINDRLKTEINKKDLENVFVEYFDRDTEIKKIVEKLDCLTDIKQLREVAIITQDDEEKFKEKKQRNVFLLGLNIKEKMAECSRYEENLTLVKEKVEALNSKFSNSRIEKTKELITTRNNLKVLSAEEGIETLNGETIYNLGSTEWKEFILSAKKYYDSITEDIDHCIFCGQDIRNIEVIDKYWKYLKSKSEQELRKAELDIKKVAQDFAKQKFQLLVQESKFDDWLKKSVPDLRKALMDAEIEFEKLNTSLIDNLSSLDWKLPVEEYRVETGGFDEAFEALKKDKEALNSEKVDKELSEIKNYLDWYHDKLQLEKLLPRIEAYLKDLKWVQTAKSINMSTGRITNFQSRLFKHFVTNEYIERFNEECEKLNANFSATIKQRGRKGTTLKKLTVKGKTPVDILSEGEQRSISLANFLAETGLNDDNMCIILDDPVCSLDYKRREVIAKRLVEEAKKKQVVILTHDITFLLLVQDLCQTQEIDCCATTIRKIQQSSGVLQNSLPWLSMSVNKRLGSLQNKLQNIEKLHKSITPLNTAPIEEYERAVKLWCEELRETWERTVEEILFNNSVQRYSPAIQTQRLKKAPFTTALYEELEAGMASCSNWVHDRAGGLGEGIPEPEELKSYLANCRDFVKNNKAK